MYVLSLPFSLTHTGIKQILYVFVPCTHTHTYRQTYTCDNIPGHKHTYIDIHSITFCKIRRDNIYTHYRYLSLSIFSPSLAQTVTYTLKYTHTITFLSFLLRTHTRHIQQNTFSLPKAQIQISTLSHTNTHKRRSTTHLLVFSPSLVQTRTYTLTYKHTITFLRFLLRKLITNAQIQIRTLSHTYMHRRSYAQTSHPSIYIRSNT